MKTVFRTLTVLTVGACALASCTVNAQLLADRFYFKADAGAAYVMDTDLDGFFGPVAPGTEVEFDIGPRVGLGAGYSLTDWFAAEIEVGFMYNNLDNITGATEVDAVVGTTPFLVNAKLQLPTKSVVVPYVGAGVGGAAMFLDSDYTELDGTGVWGSESTVAFAYQFFGGVQFNLNKSMAVGVEYRYFAVDDPEFDGSNGIVFGHMQGHAVSATFTFRF